MSKKNFKGGLSSLLGDQPSPAKTGRPRTQTKKPTKSSEEGTKEGETRATFIVKIELLEKLKALAYWKRRLIKDEVNDLLAEAIERYEAESGKIKPIPKK